MFDLTTILTLIAPAVIAPIACLLLLRAIGRAEAKRRATPAPAQPQIRLDTQIVLDSATAPLVADRTVTRNVA